MMPGRGQRWTVEQQVNKLRADLTRRHIPHSALSAAQLHHVIVIVGDLELAGDAVAMYPRPAWLELLIGPFPLEAVMDLELTEMRHTGDRAHTDEWGHMGE